MNILDYPGLVIFLIFIAVVIFMIYKDSRESKRVGNLGGLHTITQGLNFSSDQFDRDTEALSDITTKNQAK